MSEDYHYPDVKIFLSRSGPKVPVNWDLYLLCITARLQNAVLLLSASAVRASDPTTRRACDVSQEREAMERAANLKLYKPSLIKSTGRWVARFSYEGVTHGTSAKTEAEAVVARDALLQRTVRGDTPAVVVRSSKTVSALCGLWLQAVSEQPSPGVQRYGDVPVAATTVASYAALLRRHCDAKTFGTSGGNATEAGKAFGALAVAQVKPADVKKLLDAMREKGYGVGTRQCLHGRLQQVFAYGVQLGWLQADSDGRKGFATAIQAVPRPKGGSTPRMHLTAPQARILLDTAQASRDRWADAVELLVRTGLRREELLALTWSKVRLDDDGGGGWLTVDVGLKREAKRLGQVSHLVVGSVKSASSRREVRLTVESVEALKRQYERQKHDQVLAAHRWIGGIPGDDDVPIFANLVGGWSDPVIFNDGFRRIADAANFPKLTIHGCRHTFVSIAGDQMLKDTGSVNWRQLADMAGHKDERITRTVYAHLDQEAIEAARRESWTQAGAVRI
jgi:integrase